MLSGRIQPPSLGSEVMIVVDLKEFARGPGTVSSRDRSLQEA